MGEGADAKLADFGESTVFDQARAWRLAQEAKDEGEERAMDVLSMTMVGTKMYCE